MDNPNRAAAIRLIQGLGAGDRAAVDSVLADDVVQIVPSHNPAFSAPRSRAEILAMIDDAKGAFAGLTLTMSGVTCEGDRVAVEAESRATYVPNGRIYNNRYHFLLEFRDGKIAKIREYCDTLHIAETMAP